MSKPATTAARAAQLEACRALFGEHPANTIAPIRVGGDALHWLDSLLYAIDMLASDTSPGRDMHIRSMVAMGRHIAQDIGSYMDEQHGAAARRIEGEGGAA